MPLLFAVCHEKIPLASCENLPLRGSGRYKQKEDCKSRKFGTITCLSVQVCIGEIQERHPQQLDTRQDIRSSQGRSHNFAVWDVEVRETWKTARRVYSPEYARTRARPHTAKGRRKSFWNFRGFLDAFMLRHCCGKC